MSWAEGIEDAVSMDATKAMRANAQPDSSGYHHRSL